MYSLLLCKYFLDCNIWKQKSTQIHAWSGLPSSLYSVLGKYLNEVYQKNGQKLYYVIFPKDISPTEVFTNDFSPTEKTSGSFWSLYVIWLFKFMLS